MIPALQYKISRRSEAAMKLCAAAFTNTRDARSHWIKLICTPGVFDLILLIRASALFLLRPLK